MRRVVSVIGPGHCTRREYALACEVGRLLARRDVVVATGGLFGVMEAACLGAKEAGGTTLGILPNYLRYDANRYVDVAVPTGLRDARNVLVATVGEAAIAVGGGLGTLSEIALALKHGIPVVAAGGTWRLDPDRLFERMVPVARNAEEAVTLAIRFADERERMRDWRAPGEDGEDGEDRSPGIDDEDDGGEAADDPGR
jgi:uncharacterized protein (TIGR00725 family)